MGFLDFFTCCDNSSNVKIVDSDQATFSVELESIDVPFNETKVALDYNFILPLKSDSLPTLVLDLDSTLVYSSYELIENYNFKVNIKGENLITTIYVKERPYLRSFIKECSEKYEIVIFTASKEVYASQVIAKIDDHKCVKHILYRESCTLIENNYIKDISLLGRDLKRMIIVDDSQIAFSLQPQNGILIKPFYGDDEDNALNHLCNKLIEISEADNMLECINNEISQDAFI